MPALSQSQLKSVVTGLAQILDSLQIDYAIMGGAAVCLLAYDPARRTEDVDFVIQVDQRMITADRLTTQLITSYPSHFDPIDQYGHTIPGYKLRYREVGPFWCSLKYSTTKAGHNVLSITFTPLAEEYSTLMDKR